MPEDNNELFDLTENEDTEARPAQSYFMVNSNINVKKFKIDKRLLSVEEAKTNLDKMDTNFVLYNSYARIDKAGTKNAMAKYFNPYGHTVGAVFSFYKKTPNQKYYEFITDLPLSEYALTDFNITNDEKYHYLVTVGVNGIYSFYEAQEGSIDKPYWVNTKWDFWTITDVLPSDTDGVYIQQGNVWKLRYNLESDGYTYNTSVTAWDSLSPYAKYSIGQKNYDSSNISCLLGDIKEYMIDENGEVKTIFGYTEKGNVWSKDQYNESFTKELPYTREVEKMQAWREFITNGNLKLIRDIKGNAWIAQIVSSSASNDLASNYMQTRVSFNWQQADKTEGTSIIRMGEE